MDIPATTHWEGPMDLMESMKYALQAGTAGTPSVVTKAEQHHAPTTFLCAMDTALHVGTMKPACQSEHTETLPPKSQRQVFE